MNDYEIQKIRDTAFCSGYNTAVSKYEKQNKELQKENAELKTKVENQKSFLEKIRAKFNLGELEKKEIEGYLEGEQLTKAKELLKKVLDLKKVVTKAEEYLLLEEAEQFLNEVEK